MLVGGVVPPLVPVVPDPVVPDPFDPVSVAPVPVPGIPVPVSLSWPVPIVSVVPVVSIDPSAPIVPVVPVVPSGVPILSAGISVVVSVIASSPVVSASLPEHPASSAKGAAVNKKYFFMVIAPSGGTANMNAYLLFQFEDAIAFNWGFDRSSVNAFYRTTVANIIVMPTLKSSPCGISKK